MTLCVNEKFYQNIIGVIFWGVLAMEKKWGFVNLDI
jgi:hypothetical protein